MEGCTEKKNVGIAMIFRERNGKIGLSKLQRNIISELSITLKDKLVEKDGIIVFENAGITYAISRMPVGIPKEDFESALNYSVLFINKENVASKQSAHIIVSVISKPNTIIENQLILTKFVRAIIKSTITLGVYWGSAIHLIQSDIYIDLTNEIADDFLPIPIWVNTDDKEVLRMEM